MKNQDFLNLLIENINKELSDEQLKYIHRKL